MRKWLKRAAYTLLVLIILLNVIAVIQAYHATHFYNEDLPKKHINEMSFSEKLSAVLFGVRVPKSKTVDNLTKPHITVKFKTEDGLTLAAWYCARLADDSTLATKGTVIMFHGHGGSRSGVTTEAEIFYGMGYHVLMVDFRAHGESEGNTCTIGFEESKDVKAAYDYIAAKGEKNIILWGTSLGSATIITAIYDYPKIKPARVVLEMPFGSLFDAAKGTMRLNHVPEEPAAVLLTFWGGVEHGFSGFGFKPEEYAKKIECPVLLLRGTNDIRVTEEETQAIYKNVPSSNKMLVEFANCGHESLYGKDPIRWMAAVSTFVSGR